MNASGLFITGTSTEVGKTQVAAMIARALVREGRKVGVYKPAASGCHDTREGRVSEDALALWEAAGRPDVLERVCRYMFLAPLAPHLAARLESCEVQPTELRSGIMSWRAISDIVLVEGSGGLMSPLSDVLYNIDLAVEFGYPLVIVAPNELGVINATLQTVITARAKAPQLRIAGVVLNQASRRENDASIASNAEELAARCDAPLLAIVEHGAEEFSKRVDWFALAST
jgi:dethiobiotin synthetase